LPSPLSLHDALPILPQHTGSDTAGLRALSLALGDSQSFARARTAVAAGTDHLDISCARGAQPFLTAAIAQRPLLIVTATSRDAEDLTRSLADTYDPNRVALFPSWETLPHERLSPRSDTVGARLAVLRRLAHPDADDAVYGPLDIVVAPIRSVLQPIAKGLGDLAPVALRVGDEHPLERAVEALAGAAYSRTDLVERRGEFAVRGGILDVFPPTEEYPIRVEFFGDEVEEIR